MPCSGLDEAQPRSGQAAGRVWREGSAINGFRVVKSVNEGRDKLQQLVFAAPAPRRTALPTRGVSSSHSSGNLTSLVFRTNAR